MSNLADWNVTAGGASTPSPGSSTDWSNIGQQLLSCDSPAVAQPETEGDGAEGGGCRGVYFDHIRHLWRANWPEETIVMDRDTKRPLEIRRCTRTKGFSAKKFGFQESKRMAVAHRKTMITSGVIRKYIYQPASAVQSSSSATGTKIRQSKNKKRKGAGKTPNLPTSPDIGSIEAAALGAATLGAATLSDAVNDPPHLIGGTQLQPTLNQGTLTQAPLAQAPLSSSGIHRQPADLMISNQSPGTVSTEAPPSPALDLMLCLGRSGEVDHTGRYNDSGGGGGGGGPGSGGAQDGSTVAYDFTFL